MGDEIRIFERKETRKVLLLKFELTWVTKALAFLAVREMDFERVADLTTHLVADLDLYEITVGRILRQSLSWRTS